MRTARGFDARDDKPELPPAPLKLAWQWWDLLVASRLYQTHGPGAVSRLYDSNLLEPIEAAMQQFPHEDAVESARELIKQVRGRRMSPTWPMSETRQQFEREQMQSAILREAA